MGYRKAILTVWLGFLLNFLFIAAAAIVDVLPGADYWTNGEGFHAIFGLSARITFASFIAFLCGSFINAFIMSRLKENMLARSYLFDIFSALWSVRRSIPSSFSPSPSSASSQERKYWTKPSTSSF